MKKRRLLPVAALSLLIALVISRIPNLNTREEGSQTPESEVAEADASARSMFGDASGEAPDTTQGTLQLVDVLVDGNTYLVREIDGDAVPDPDARQSLAIPAIISLVDQAVGDASGTRVRISRTPEAIAEAVFRLETALYDAAISEDAIESRQRLVQTEPDRGPSDPPRSDR